MTTGGEYTALVDQARGMVSEQAGCTMDEALALMQNTAEATSETLEFVAAEGVARRVSVYPPA